MLVVALFALVLILMSRYKALQGHFNDFLDYFKAAQRYEADLSFHMFERIRQIEAKQRNQEVTWQ